MILSRLKTITTICIFSALLLAGVGLYYIEHTAASPAPPTSSIPLQTAVYVWQQDWSPAVGAAVLQSREKVDRFFVYAARLELSGDALRAVPNHLDWPALASAARPVVLVMRAPEALARLLAAGQAPAVTGAFLDSYTHLAADAAQSGCHIDGLQLDYDCPTARLNDYRALLENLRPRLGPAELSITALPTWMDAKAFGPLVRAVPWYTLQVHGIERPTMIDKPIVLCDARRIAPWLRRAAAYRVPFFVALPTYGYRVVFDAGGHFAALVAEGPESPLRPGYQERRAAANPAEMAAVVRDLRRAPPPGCRGVIWFRLPFATDRLNWPWPELAAVMDGREPRAEFKAELRTPEPSLYEVWVANTGELETDRPISITTNLTGQNIIASDVMKGFNLDQQGTLRGAAPPLGPPRLAAWFRVAANSGAEPIKLGKVE